MQSGIEQELKIHGSFSVAHMLEHSVGESAGLECKAVLQETTQLIETKLATNGKALRATFNADNLVVDGDFLYYMADAAATAIQYGNPDKLCNPMVEAKKAGKDLVDAYAKYVQEYYVGVNVKVYDREYLKNTTIDEYSNYRSWWFQVCTEVASFQVAPSNDSIRSSKIDTKYHLDLCKYVFGDGVFPVVDATNLYYGGTKIAGSKIIFTNGSQDPWRRASKQTSSPDIMLLLTENATCNTLKCLTLRVTAWSVFPIGPATKT
ncbi:thymus-specific serine protease [Trifolium medium]|uniref:Thymus-specific serine protease n=1 Tax=Trifolium medium TaxID=97028 RepID=A0A392LYQ2_9FABA|nr:thymus-specific serine protease [Trifolium medium]